MVVVAVSSSDWHRLNAAAADDDDDEVIDAEGGDSLYILPPSVRPPPARRTSSAVRDLDTELGEHALSPAYCSGHVGSYVARLSLFFTTSAPNSNAKTQSASREYFLQILAKGYNLRVSKKQDTVLLPITLPNIRLIMGKSRVPCFPFLTHEVIN